MSKRAINDFDKNLKKERLMTSAMTLLEIGQFPLPSVNQIILHAKEAKGTFYLYFKSKEEIYMQLLAKEFEIFFHKFAQELSAGQSVSQTLSKTFIEFTKKSPKIIYLATITSLILENNLDHDYLVEFKKNLWKVTTNIANLIQPLSDLSNEQCKNNFLICYSLYLSMWQHNHPPRHVQKILEENNLLGLQYDLDVEFTGIIEKIWKK